MRLTPLLPGGLHLHVHSYLVRQAGAAGFHGLIPLQPPLAPVDLGVRAEAGMLLPPRVAALPFEDAAVIVELVQLMIASDSELRGSAADRAGPCGADSRSPGRLAPDHGLTSAA